MAGFWHLSHHQMRDPNGRVYAGARATFLEADTLDPIIVYQDYGLGTPHPSPVVANAYGVFPPVFFDEADEFYRQRITDSGGVLIPGTDVGTLPIIGPSGGGGGSEVPVDPSALLKTGDVIWLDQSGARSGFVRDNGRTIGSAVSGATERANADCEALYLFLWTTYSDTICPVTSGRGISAVADWAANKPIGMPDKRGRGPFGLDDMGSTSANRLQNVTFSLGNSTTPGSLGGAALHTLVVNELPAHSHGVTDPGHTHGFTDNAWTGSSQGGPGSGSLLGGPASAADTTDSATTGITINNAGGDVAHNNMPPFITGTFYRKL